MKIWHCWIYSKRRGNITKVPVAASGEETGPDEAHRNTWVTFDEAKTATAEKHFDGIGFVIPKGYFFLDIDHRPVDDPFVVKMLERFSSYTEYSVSGGGIHIYGRCDFSKIPSEMKDNKLTLNRKYYIKNPTNDTELYIGGLTNRFAVFTENMILNEPLRECTDAIFVTLEEDMLRRSQYNDVNKDNKDSVDIELNAETVIEGLSRQKNRGKFYQLFRDGDISDYGSHSEADLALCSIIAFRAGECPDLIDAVFRKSALYREKWERDDYREETIRKGIEACHGNFHQSVKPHPIFIRINEDTGKASVSVPLLAQYVRVHLRYLLVRDNGKQGLLKYVYENGVYKLCADEMFKGYIKRFIEDYDPELVKISQVNEVYQHILTDRNYTSQSELDSREDIINFKNGLLVITPDDLKLIPHTPDVYSTIQIPCDWTDKRSDTPVFINYMKTLTNGDNTVVRLLLQFMGVSISNVKGWRMKKSLFLVGPGDTGKSLLKSLVELLIGFGNYIGIDLKEIEARFGTGAVYGTRLAGSSDMSYLSVDELKTFKRLTGGDSVFAEFKGMQGFEYTYNGVLWFCMNKLPRFGGDNGKWVYDRIMIVNCPNVIPPEHQDKELLDKLYAEREGIIYIAVKSLQQVIRNGYRYDEPESVIQARERYMSENNTVIGFFEECMCPWTDGKIQKNCTTGQIYSAYKQWCQDNNNGYAKTAREFRETISTYLNAPYENLTTRLHGNTYYKDFGLNRETREKYCFGLAVD